MIRPRLHGTDGIRGKVDQFSGDDDAALLALIEQRILSKRSMRIIGEATGLYLLRHIGDSPLVLIVLLKLLLNLNMVSLFLQPYL